MATTSSMGTIPTTLSTGMINPMTEVGPTYNNGSLHPNQKECVPVGTDLSVVGHRAVSPSSGHIIGEGATIFRHDRNYVRCSGLTDGFVN